MEHEIKCPVVEQQRTLSQKDAVYQFFSEALGSKGNVRAEGEPLKVLFTKNIKKVVRAKLHHAITNSIIKCKPQYDDKKLRKYCSGLISNWLIKDERYNK